MGEAWLITSSTFRAVCAERRAVAANHRASLNTSSILRYAATRYNSIQMNRLLVCCLAALAAWAQEKPAAHFHHVHLNSTDPTAAIEFYTHHFDCEKASYRGQDAVWAQKSWLLFN